MIPLLSKIAIYWQVETFTFSHVKYKIQFNLIASLFETCSSKYLQQISSRNQIPINHSRRAKLYKLENLSTEFLARGNFSDEML